MKFVAQRLRKFAEGGALAETLVAMLALTPFAIGIPLLGKQLDVKEKSIDATRYSVWERTVWRSSGSSNVKTTDDILVEARDRIAGNARAGLLSPQDLRSQGVTENVLWVDRANTRLLVPETNGIKPVAVSDRYEHSPKDVGWLNVPGAAYGSGSVFTIFKVIGWKSLGFNEDSFARGDTTIRVRDTLGELSGRSSTLNKSNANLSIPSLEQLSQGGILSDTWSAKDEAGYRKGIGRLTVDEGLVTVETPGLAIGVLGAKGNALYGEGQYGWGRGLGKGPDPSVPSTVLPGDYIGDQN